MVFVVVSLWSRRLPLRSNRTAVWQAVWLLWPCEPLTHGQDDRLSAFFDLVYTDSSFILTPYLTWWSLHLSQHPQRNIHSFIKPLLSAKTTTYNAISIFIGRYPFYNWVDRSMAWLGYSNPNAYSNIKIVGTLSTTSRFTGEAWPWLPIRQSSRGWQTIVWPPGGNLVTERHVRLAVLINIYRKHARRSCSNSLCVKIGSFLLNYMTSCPLQ